MNSRVNPEYLEIQSLLEGLEVACLNEQLYVTLRLARQASGIFRIITAGFGSDYDVFDVMAMLKGAEAHDETTGAQRAIIAVALDALAALAKGPNNPGDLPEVGAPAPAIVGGVAPLTKDSDMSVMEPVGRLLAMEANWAIEPMCDEILEQIIEANVDTDTMRPCEVMVALTTRIKALNSILMSALDGEDITLAHAAKVIHGNPGERHLASALRAANVRAGARTPEADFMEGRDLALAMVTAGGDYYDDTRASLDGQYRDGKPQENFTRRYIMTILTRPTLLDGFSAALSGLWCLPDFPGLDGLGFLSEPTYAQIQSPPKAATASKNAKRACVAAAA